MNKEVWKDIPEYEGLYQVSSLGRVRNNKNYILSNSVRYGGYTYVSLSKNGQQKNIAVHILVMLAFVGKKENDNIQINHIDENPKNNKLENLEYITQQENCNYGKRIERVIQTKSQNEGKKIYCAQDEDGINIIKIYNKAKQVREDGYNYDAVLQASLGHYGTGTHKYKNIYWFRKDFDLNE